MNFFYKGLTPKKKKLVEMMCQGAFMSKNAREAEAYFEWLAKNTPEWEKREITRGVDKSASKQNRIFLLKAEDKLANKYEDLA